ncbi:Urea ABC transporter, substrate binding protein UrtA [Rhodococcus wratislaviensis]|uniref:Urea ABC transporter, substrate binding protein UrtA n=1 Tax=Rhodococcus wratislaviensis TaxID=44752 RepID=A0A402CLA7_RHOWR|nr:ABC transporter substrate-binding protein [Rhodococcus wratislaviensis]GCE44308.1 Urea ABC transporter, substrate binding protein UrtA [Rhodococcus wratislaviensis]
MTHVRITKKTLGRVGLIALVPAFALATACSGSDADDTASSAIDAPASAFPDKPANGTPIKIGLINPEGGPAISQPSNREAAEAVVKYANANLGGIAGHPVELVTCASKEDPASARDCANQMVEAGVAAVVVTTTGQGDSMAPIITQAGITYLSPSGASKSELSSSNSFMLTGGFPGTLSTMASYAKENGYKKVTVFASDNSTVVPATKAMGGPAFQAAGVELQVIPVPLGTPDTTPQVSSGISEDVGGVAVVGDATMCTSVVKALQTLGATQDKMLIQPCLDPSTVQAVGDAMEGAHVFTTADLTSDNEEAVLYRSVMAKYSPGTETAGYTYTGYQGMLGLVRAAQSVQGEPTAPAIAAAIKSAKNVPLPAGDGITFSCDGSAMPSMPAICSIKGVTVTIENGDPIDPQVTG